MNSPESNQICSFGTSIYDETTLIASPSYPNSICWSDENLLAVASGKLITILVKRTFILFFYANANLVFVYNQSY
jgi:hypothetical protein